MSITATDWSIDRSTGDIRYIGDDHGGASPSYATVIDFHRWLQGLADDAVAVGDDEMDITNNNPSARSTDNIITLLGAYNIDDNAAEHLYDGTIIQASGDTIYDGIVNFGNADVQIQLIQNGEVLADDWWNFNGAGLNPDANAGISHRFMLKVRDSGADIDGRRVLGICRRFGYTYSEFPINGTARGNNVLALADAADLNNQTAEGTVSGWTTITNTTEGYAAIDVDNDGSDEYFYSEWNRDTHSINDFYERMKWVTREGSSETLYGLSGELFRGITHQIAVDNILSGPLSEVEELTWTENTIVSSGQMLAVDSVSAPTTIWIQLLKGIPPTDGTTLTGSTSGATVDVNVTVTDRTALIKTPFCGASTGSAIIGSYGFGIEATDLTSNDKVFDLTNTQKTPPNYVTNIVAGVVSGEDRILVAPWDGSTLDAENNPAIQKDQLSLSGTLSTDDVATITVSTGIPSDTPASGTIRVTDDNGLERWIPYSSWSGSDFTVDTGNGDIGTNNDFATVNATTGNNVYITYVDSLYDGTNSTDRFTSVYSTDRNLVVIVRDGGGTPIKEFISAWSLTSAGKSITAIRTTDA